MSTSAITNTREYYDLVNPSYISWEFYSQYVDREPPFGDLGLIVHLRTYSRFVEELSRREKWCECCLRTVEYSVSLDNKSPVAWKKAEAEKLFDMMFNMRGFPAGRTLWMGDKNKAIAQTANFNCSFRVIDSISAYSEIMYLLMVGAGAGFSVQNEYVSKLPTFNTDFKVDHIPFVKQVKAANQDDTVLELTDGYWDGYVYRNTFTEQDLIKPEGYFIPATADIQSYSEARITVGDSRVGWNNALRLFLELLTHTNIKNISIDYSLIRPKGARLKTFGGRASGYLPLKTFFRKAEWLIKNCGGKFTSVVAMDLANIIAEVVVVAGVRRSSEIGIGDAWDVAFKTAKYNLFKYAPGITSSGLDLIPDDGDMRAVYEIAETYRDYITVADILASDADHGGLLPTLAKRYDLWDTQDPKNIEIQKLVDSIDPKFRYRESRVMSNNSIGLQTKPSREELETLVTFIKNNGEPGLFNYEAGRKRRSDFQGSNPCFTGDMELKTSTGYVAFEVLADLNSYVDLVDYQGRIRKGIVQQTGVKPCVTIELSNGQILKSTPDHIWKTVDGQAEAKDLLGKTLIDYATLNLKTTVVSIAELPPEPVYDFSLESLRSATEEDTHWGVINGFVAHNCGEILLRDRGVCNLTEGNLRAYVRPDKSFDFTTFESDLRLLTRIGSRVTLVKMWHPDWDTVQSEDRLLGVSLTGQCDAWLAMENPSDTVKNEILAFAKRVVRDEEEKYHTFLGIPRSKLTTTGKPSGTIAQLPTVSSGCHQPYAPYYFRNIRISSTDPLARVLRDAGVPVAPNGNKGTLEESDTWVFTFPIKTNAQIKSVDEPVLEQLERYKNLMQHYVEHNQSVTISVAPDEWDLVVNWLDENWDNFVGISFLPKFDSTIGEDGSFPQMPYVTANEERYNEMLPKFPRLQEDQLIEMIAQYEKSQEEYVLEDSCSTGACPVR